MQTARGSILKRVTVMCAHFIASRSVYHDAFLSVFECSEHNVSKVSAILSVTSYDENQLTFLFRCCGTDGADSATITTNATIIAIAVPSIVFLPLLNIPRPQRNIAFKQDRVNPLKADIRERRYFTQR
jgi:hypothetical protein